MRLMMVQTSRGHRLAVDVDGRSVRSSEAGGPETLSELIEAGPEALAALRSAVTAVPNTVGRPVADEALALPLAKPGKIICMGLNFVDHAREGGFSIPEYPAIFLRSASSLVPAGEPMVRPAVSDTFDYEAELLVVIGKRAKHVSDADALKYVFGYSIFNDGSVRNYQRKTPQWTAGKNFDGTGAFGPVIVTADALPPGAAGLRIRSLLNGQVMQDGTSDDMIFPVARAVSLMSEIMTLEPGDLIAMGTPAGVGHARKPPVWMKPGDEIVIEIDGIGRLQNTIIDEIVPKASDAA